MDQLETKLKNAIEVFHASAKTTDDYLTFIHVIHMVLKQGGGLTFGQVRDVLSTTLENVND